MMRKSSESSLLKSPVARILGVVLPIAAIVFLVLQQANFLVGRALLIAFGDVETTYKSAWLEWDGDIVAKNLVIYPSDEIDDQAATIKFERIHVETPGWFWFLRNTFDRKLRVAKLDRVHLTLEGGSSDAGIDPSLGDLGPFGAASASPFEAEGCLQDSMWLREQLQQMDLDPEPTRLEFDYKATGQDLFTTITLDTPRASRVTLQRRERLPGRVNVLLLDFVGGEVVSERWEVEDQGFVSARNRFCAKKDGIDARRFIERHIESVERLLATQGIGLGDEGRTAYRRFVRDGGKLSFGGEYHPPLPVEELYDLRGNGDAWRRIIARLEHNGRSYPVQWQRFRPRPLPGLDDGKPTYALLQKERASAPANAEPVAETAPAAAADATITVPPMGTDAVAATTVPADVTSSATTDASDAASTASAATATDPSAATTPSAATNEPATTATTASTPATDTATTPVASTASSKPLASSAPTATRGPRPGTALQWADLPAMRGRLVRIWTVHNPPRTVEIIEGNAASIRVTARLGGGSAEYTVQREGFRKATLIQ